MERRKLPIRIQDFEDMRTSGTCSEEIAGQPQLAIVQQEKEWKKHPVIFLDMNRGMYNS